MWSREELVRALAQRPSSYLYATRVRGGPRFEQSISYQDTDRVLRLASGVPAGAVLPAAGGQGILQSLAENVLRVATTTHSSRIDGSVRVFEVERQTVDDRPSKNLCRPNSDVR